jgi:predicted RecB family endonuclease
MIRQELENLSIEQLLELKEMMDAEIRRKRQAERNVAVKELNEAWKKFRKTCPSESRWLTYQCDECDCGIDIDLYDIIDAYEFK